MAYTTIDDPSAHFQTLIYTGNGGASRALTNTGNSDLQPDWLWIKKRNASRSHTLTDSSRGLTKYYEADDNGAEGTFTDKVLSVQSDGFTVGDNSSVNANNDTYVAWQWKANGGTTTTNDASSTSVGTIDSVYQANTTAGFSIVTYTGTGSAGTIAHGLGVAPTVIIGKDRSDTSQWFVQHPALGATHYGELDDTTAFADDANYFNDSTPTSTVFGVGSDGATGGTTNYVAYCFAPIQGYSKFGSYTGNNNADGPFVYTGFKPAWVMWKRSDASGNSWGLVDHRRNKNDTSDIGNVIDAYLNPDLNNDDGGNSATMDFLSNGFKIRRTGNFINVDGSTYIYMAFAESPFVSSEGVPTTAR